MAKLWPKVWFSTWRPSPFWILRDINFASIINYAGTPFSVSVSNLVWIRSKMAELWPYNWFQNSGGRHLGFLHYVNFDGKSGCMTPFSAYVSNLVQIYTKMADLLKKLWFSTWRPPPCWILQNINFAGKTSYETPFLILCQIWCESVQKWPSYVHLTDFRMVATAILDFWPMLILMENMPKMVKIKLRAWAGPIPHFSGDRSGLPFFSILVTTSRWDCWTDRDA